MLLPVVLLFLYGALDSHPFFPSHVALGRCVLSAAAAGAPAGVVSAFAEPSSWCAPPLLLRCTAVPIHPSAGPPPRVAMGRGAARARRPTVRNRSRTNQENDGQTGTRAWANQCLRRGWGGVPVWHDRVRPPVVWSHGRPDC